ncbi:MAG: hypothetical protein PHO32_04230, partial [Candidatus Cloacimonetes bacterium]|nr:hypothetical protein [Candidatus Cloacimonadota bacterium]
KLYAIKLMDELAEAKCGSDYARTSDIKDEMEKISDYLKQCLNTRGKIKMDNKIQRSHAHLIRSSVKQFYSALKPINPELTNYLQSHLVIGSKCYWEANPKSHKVG